MGHVQIMWDLEDDPDGNYWHICVAGHDVTQPEVDEVLLNPKSDTDVSRSSGQWITFGWTTTGKYIAVVWEKVAEDPLAIYPLTAYPVNPPRGTNP
jgi:hypothetical protein